MLQKGLAGLFLLQLSLEAGLCCKEHRASVQGSVTFPVAQDKVLGTSVLPPQSGRCHQSQATISLALMEQDQDTNGEEC